MNEIIYTKYLVFEKYYSKETSIADVANDPELGDYGRLIFPVNSGYMSSSTLGDLRLTWYNYIDPDKTVEICNYMKAHAENGDVIFHDIYSEAEKKAKEYLEKQVQKCVVKSKTAQKGLIELNMEVRMKNDDTDFINTISEMEGVNSAVLVSYNGEYMG